MAERVGVEAKGGKKEHTLKAGKVAHIPSTYLTLYTFLLGSIMLYSKCHFQASNASKSQEYTSSTIFSCGNSWGFSSMVQLNPCGLNSVCTSIEPGLVFCVEEEQSTLPTVWTLCQGNSSHPDLYLALPRQETSPMSWLNIPVLVQEGHFSATRECAKKIVQNLSEGPFGEQRK